MLLSCNRLYAPTLNGKGNAVPGAPSETAELVHISCNGGLCHMSTHLLETGLRPTFLLSVDKKQLLGCNNFKSQLMQDGCEIVTEMKGCMPD